MMWRALLTVVLLSGSPAFALGTQVEPGDTLAFRRCCPLHLLAGAMPPLPQCSTDEIVFDCLPQLSAPRREEVLP